MNKEEKTKVIRTVRPYDEFFLLSKFALKQAGEQKEYLYYYCIVAIVFCAFSLEAYLNHIGEKSYNIWDPKDNRLSPDKKLTCISELKNLVIDKKKEPFSYFGTIFKYRDSIVHSRTETISNWQKIENNEIPDMPLLAWEKETTLEKAQKYCENTRDMIVFLSKEIEDEDFPLGAPSEAMWCSG